MESRSGRTRDALLVYPPMVASSVHGPHLAPALLSSFLRRKGLDVVMWDGNIRFFRWLLDPERLNPRLAAMRDRFHDLNRRASLTQEEYLDMRRVTVAMDLNVEAIVPRSTSMRVDNSSTFGALADTVTAIYSAELSAVLRSVETVAAAVGRGSEDRSILTRFFEEQETFFTGLGQVGLVGINVSFSEQLHAAAVLADQIRRRLGAHRPVVLLGGTQISLLQPSQIEQLLNLPFLDGVVVFEGERPLKNAIQRVRSSLAEGKLPAETDLSGVPNLCTRSRPKPDAFAEPVAPDELPSPTFVQEELDLYFSPVVLPVYVTKGCYWGKCTFCDYTKVYTPTSRRWVSRNVELVVSDLKHLVRRHGVTTYQLISEAVPPSWYRRFARAVIREKLQLSFFSYLKNERAEILTQDFFNLLSDAGVVCLVCGVESPVDRVLEVVGKGVRRCDIETNFRMMAAAGIRGICNLIPDYPSSTFEDAQATIQFVFENIDKISLVTCQFFDLSAHSVITRSPQEFGISVDTETLVDSSHGCHSISFTQRTMTPEQYRLLRIGFESLSAFVSRYHYTKAVRCVLEHPRFDWMTSSFLFAGFRRVLTRYAMVPAASILTPMSDVIHARDEMIWLRHSNIRLAAELTFPPTMLPFVELMERKEVISFESICGLFDRVSSARIGELLLKLARLGFIEKVFGGLPLDLSPEIRAICGGTAHAEDRQDPGV